MRPNYADAIIPCLFGFLSGGTVILLVNLPSWAPIMLILMVLFAFMTFIGNLYAVKTSIKNKTVVNLIISFFIIVIIESFLISEDLATYINVGLTSMFSFGFILKALLANVGGMSFKLIVDNFKLIFSSVKEHLLKLKLGAVLGLGMEAYLLYYIAKGFQGLWIAYPMLLFWGISGVLFVLLRGTKYCLTAKTKEIIILCKVYGTARLTYYLLPFLLIQQELHTIWFLYFFTASFLGFIYGLIPYIFGSDELKDAIRLLKEINKSPRRIKELSRVLNISKPELEGQLKGMKLKQLVSLRSDNKWGLHPSFKLLF